MNTATTTTIPRFLPGTWTIDPVHSEVSFTVRHLMVGKVRGRFGAFRAPSSRIRIRSTRK